MNSLPLNQSVFTMSANTSSYDSRNFSALSFSAIGIISPQKYYTTAFFKMQHFRQFFWRGSGFINPLQSNKEVLINSKMSIGEEIFL